MADEIQVNLTSTTVQAGGVYSGDTVIGAASMVDSKRLVSALAVGAVQESALLDAIAGGYVLTIGGTLTGARTITAPDASLTLAGQDYANVFTAAQIVRVAAGLTVQQASTQDAVALVGRAGGTSSYTASITPGTLTGNITLTLPVSTTTLGGLAITQTWTGVNTFTTSTKITATAGVERYIEFETGGVSRWRALTGSTAESGSNAGSNFRIRAYDDAGVQIDEPIIITRASGGSITISRPLSGTSGTFSSLTPGRITTAGTGGLLQDFAGFGVSGTPSATAPSTGTNGPGLAAGLQWQAADGAGGGTTLTTFGNGSAQAILLQGFACQGTAASPGATISSDRVAINLKGYDGTSFTTSSAQILLQANSAWTNTNHEAKIIFNVVANAATAQTTALTLAATAATFAIPLQPGSGSAGAPSYAFSTETNTGVFRPNAGVLGIATAGAERFRFGGNQFTLNFNSVAIGTAPITSFATLSFHAADTTQGTIGISTYGALPMFLCRRAEGTAGALTQTTSGVNLFSLASMGYEATTPGFTGQRAHQLVVSTEVYTSTAQGFRQDFFTVANGATGTSQRMRLDQDGNLLLGTTTNGMTAGGSLAVAQDLAHRGTKAGFYNRSPVTQAAVPTIGAMTVSGTAGASYTATEQGMINALKADVATLRAGIIAVLNKFDQTAGTVGLLSGTAT